MIFQKKTRNALVLTLVVAFAVAGCQGSTDQDDAKKHTTDFMNAYYQQDDLELAIDFTAGAAQEKLQGEIDTAEEAGTQTKPRGPGIEIEMQQQSEDGSAQVMEWSVKSSAGEVLEVETSTSQIDGDWKVTEFTEKQVE